MEVQIYPVQLPFHFQRVLMCELQRQEKVQEDSVCFIALSLVILLLAYPLS